MGITPNTTAIDQPPAREELSLRQQMTAIKGIKYCQLNSIDTSFIQYWVYLKSKLNKRVSLRVLSPPRVWWMCDLDIWFWYSLGELLTAGGTQNALDLLHHPPSELDRGHCQREGGGPLKQSIVWVSIDLQLIVVTLCWCSRLRISRYLWLGLTCGVWASLMLVSRINSHLRCKVTARVLRLSGPARFGFKF